MKKVSGFWSGIDPAGTLLAEHFEDDAAEVSAEGIDGDEKATREVCLDGEINDRMAFRARADLQKKIRPSDGCGRDTVP